MPRDFFQWKKCAVAQKSLNNTALDDSVEVSAFDGLGHVILSHWTFFLNGIPCESNSYFVYTIVIRISIEIYIRIST